MPEQGPMGLPIVYSDCMLYTGGATGLNSDITALARGGRATPPPVGGAITPPPAGVDRLLSPLLPSVGSISLSSRCPIYTHQYLESPLLAQFDRVDGYWKRRLLTHGRPHGGAGDLA